ncbi:MAG: hypothetical protein IH987_13860, partial [Planctomycetes bacterium]|nr:hypothetical protein [Planctomycetota bacterium]
NYWTLSAATTWWKGSVGLGLQTLSYSTNAGTVREVALGEADLLTGGDRAASELVATLGYAQQIGGIDWGYTNPFAFLHCRLDGDERISVMDERYETQCTASDHARALKDQVKDYEWIDADHDPDNIATFRKADIPCRNAIKGDVMGGIDRVKERLKVQGDGKPQPQWRRHAVAHATGPARWQPRRCVKR